MNILLIEDDPTDVKLSSAVLSSSDHPVLETASAEQALVEIRSHRPEVILPDLKLPGMDGLALARLLREDPATSRIPIVAITAADERFGPAAALAAGCDTLIARPVDTRRLSEQLLRAAAGAPGSPNQG